MKITPANILKEHLETNPQTVMVCSEVNGEIKISFCTGSWEKACYYINRITKVINHGIDQDDLNYKLNKMDKKNGESK